MEGTRFWWYAIDSLMRKAKAERESSVREERFGWRS
jgi:hypothetical protein